MCGMQWLNIHLHIVQQVCVHAWRHRWKHTCWHPSCLPEQVLNLNFHLLVCNCGTTALHIAAANGDVHIAMLILKHYVGAGPYGSGAQEAPSQHVRFICSPAPFLSTHNASGDTLA